MEIAVSILCAVIALLVAVIVQLILRQHKLMDDKIGACASKDTVTAHRQELLDDLGQCIKRVDNEIERHHRWRHDDLGPQLRDLQRVVHTTTERLNYVEKRMNGK